MEIRKLNPDEYKENGITPPIPPADITKLNFWTIIFPFFTGPSQGPGPLNLRIRCSPTGWRTPASSASLTAAS